MKALATQEYLADPRIAEAKRLLAEAARDHQRKLTGVRPADGERKIAYDESIRTFGATRGGGLFFPYLGAGLGNGPLVELADGSVKYDLISGIGVHHFGHSHPRLLAAGIDAALRDTVMQGNLQQNVESAALAKALLERASPGTRLAHCFLTSSGAMANENALKLAFHKRPGTSRVLAFEHTFAGRTLALSNITDKAAYRTGLPAALAVDYLPFFAPDHPEESTARALATLRATMGRYPGQCGAIWCELVLGEGGFYPGSGDFWRAICAEARARNIVVIADEVQTFGRTTKLFAYQHFGMEDLVDIVTVGKMLQACATLFTDALKPAPGIVSQTFTAATAAIMAAQAIMMELLGAELFGEDGRNARVHARFVTRFEEMTRRHAAWIRGPYGVGGMVAFTPLDGSEETAKKVVHGLFEAGVIAFYCGSEPTRVRFLPPVPVISDGQIDEVCGMVEAVLSATASK
jgi:4-aminobutyrate aminotransferase-like enzyme